MIVFFHSFLSTISCISSIFQCSSPLFDFKSGCSIIICLSDCPIELYHRHCSKLLIWNRNIGNRIFIFTNRIFIFTVNPPPWWKTFSWDLEIIIESLLTPGGAIRRFNLPRIGELVIWLQSFYQIRIADEQLSVGLLNNWNPGSAVIGNKIFNWIQLNDRFKKGIEDDFCPGHLSSVGKIGPWHREYIIYVHRTYI